MTDNIDLGETDDYDTRGIKGWLFGLWLKLLNTFGLGNQ